MRLVVVSNRGPVSFGRDERGSRVARRGGGGLVTALRGLLSRHEVTWIASALGEEDRAVAAEAGGATFEQAARDGSPYRLRLVAHDPATYDRFYNGAANPLLWFVHHYLWGLATAPDLDHDAWAAYETVNRAFADAVLAELDERPADGVLFHDYQLYLAPALVRGKRPEAALAHFVHVPWPQSDYWHVLPEAWRAAVHEGLLANDVVGLHTERWRRNFARSCADLVDATVERETVEHRGRRTLTAAHPISVDAAEFDELAGSEPVLAAERRLQHGRAEQVILRVDRTDPSKNAIRGLKAFGALLDEHPEHRGRVTMLALLDPSRQEIPEYVEYLAAVEREAAAVKQRHGVAAVDLRLRDDFAETVAAYKDYDVLLVNAVYDGLNLVAKEGPLVNRRDGVLVLSENAGVHEELARWAVSVNPFDVRGQAEALHAALTMPAAERACRAEAIRAHVRAHDVSRWIEDQLADLVRARSL